VGRSPESGVRRARQERQEARLDPVASDDHVAALAAREGPALHGRIVARLRGSGSSRGLGERCRLQVAIWDVMARANRWSQDVGWEPGPSCIGRRRPAKRKAPRCLRRRDGKACLHPPERSICKE